MEVAQVARLKEIRITGREAFRAAAGIHRAWYDPAVDGPPEGRKHKRNVLWLARIGAAIHAKVIGIVNRLVRKG